MWLLRLTDLLGAPPDAALEQHLDSLVEGRVRDDADLDYKQKRYGNSDSDRRALAGDIAAMANDRGGLNRHWDPRPACEENALALGYGLAVKTPGRHAYALPPLLRWPG